MYVRFLLPAISHSLPFRSTETVGDGESKIEIKEGMFLEIALDDYILTADADVTAKLAHELIIGASTMQQWGIVVEPKEEKVVIKDPKTSFELV